MCQPPLRGRSSREFGMEREQRGIRLLPDKRAGAAAVLTNEDFWYPSLRFADVPRASSGWSANSAGFGFCRARAVGTIAVLTNEDFWYPSFRFADVPRASSGWSASGAGFGFRRTSEPELLPCLRTRTSGIQASALRTFLARVQDGARAACGSASAGHALLELPPCLRTRTSGIQASASRTFLARVQRGARAARGSAFAGRARRSCCRAYERGIPVYQPPLRGRS